MSGFSENLVIPVRQQQAVEYLPVPKKFDAPR
jgi:hypothetical protein